jgi:hypothetical protein
VRPLVPRAAGRVVADSELMAVGGAAQLTGGRCSRRWRCCPLPLPGSGPLSSPPRSESAKLAGGRDRCPRTAAQHAIFQGHTRLLRPSLTGEAASGDAPPMETSGSGLSRA